MKKLRMSVLTCVSISVSNERRDLCVCSPRRPCQQLPGTAISLTKPGPGPGRAPQTGQRSVHTHTPSPLGSARRTAHPLLQTQWGGGLSHQSQPATGQIDIEERWVVANQELHYTGFHILKGCMWVRVGCECGENRDLGWPCLSVQRLQFYCLAKLLVNPHIASN